jgi:hypothetical protein
MYNSERMEKRRPSRERITSYKNVSDHVAHVVDIVPEGGGSAIS